MISANGLGLKNIKSRAENLNIQSLNDALKYFNSNGFVIVYLDYKVLIGKVSDNKFFFYNNETIEEKYIQRMRIFNEDKEVMLWRSLDGIKGRIRIDNEGNDTYVVDASQVLWGTDKEELGNGWIKIFEDRGTELILPLEGVEVNDKERRVFLRTRNYVDFHNETKQATYVDCRFIGFITG